MLIKIVSTVPIGIIFQNIWSVNCVPILWICRKLKHHQLRIRSETFILLEVILNTFNVWQYHFWLKSLFAIVLLLFISVCILCEFAILVDVYILLSPQEEEVHSSSCGNRCTHLAAHSSKRLNPLSFIILVCLGNT